MPRRKKGNKIHGWMNFYKPVGMSSASAVNFVRWVYGAQKAGHGGTLDPLAEGVLPIALGEATKVLPFMLEGDKFYRFEMTFGSETSTDDAEGVITQSSEERPTKEALLSVLESFEGNILQTPPIYSALKINGKRACDRVRAGEDIVLEARPVIIHSINVENFSTEKAILAVHVSKGTYVRSLARDIGRALGCFAHVTRLIRSKHGVFSENETVHKEVLDTLKEKGHDAHHLLQDVDVVLDDIPVLTCTPEEEKKILAGMSVQKEMQDCKVLRLKNQKGVLFSIAQSTGYVLKPRRNFPDLVEKSNDVDIKE